MKHSIFCLVMAAVIIAFLLFVPLPPQAGVWGGGAQTQPTPTPECYIMEDGVLICISHAEATAVPATPTPQPATPMFVVVWLPVVAR